MPYKNGKIVQSIDNVDYDIYTKTSAEQVRFDDTTTVKEKLIEITNTLTNITTGSDSIDYKIKTACDTVFTKILGATNQTELNSAYDTLKEVSDYIAGHGSVINGINSDITDIQKQLIALNTKATHNNRDVLNKLSSNDKGKLLFDGKEISGDSSSSTSAVWGFITGTLTDQADLKKALDAKANTSDIPTVSNDLTNELKTKYDGAVTNSHTHTNKDTIDKLSTSDGELTFNGVKVRGDIFANKATLDKLSTGTDGKLLFDGKHVSTEPIVLAQKQYDALSADVQAKGLYYIID